MVVNDTLKIQKEIKSQRFLLTDCYIFVVNDTLKIQKEIKSQLHFCMNMFIHSC